MNKNHTTFTNSNINPLEFSGTSQIPLVLTSELFQNPNSRKESTVTEKNQMSEKEGDSQKKEEINPFNISYMNIKAQTENISNEGFQ